MRHFTVYLKPFKLDDLIAALAPFGVQALTVEEVRGYGRQKGHLELYRGSEYQITFLPKLRVEFVAPQPLERPIVEAVCEAVRTGRIGDGKVLVREVRQLRRLGG
ncbi:MAG: nitrogen regulatory protein P-II 1 [Planctomycetota bacterium]|nr:MAG: nitrogen regulatory protein P-II 1 [Planctomycetota bacterium]